MKIIVSIFVGRWDYESECRVMKENGRSSLELKDKKGHGSITTEWSD